MTLEEASLISQVVAAIAVIASLVFVGFQLRQSTRAVRSATSVAHSDLLIQLGSFAFGTDEGARIWRLGLQGLDDLTENERVRFTAFISVLMRFYEATRVQWLSGQLEMAHWHSVERQAMGLSTQPGVKAWWQVRSHWHSAEFRNWFETLEGVSDDFRFYSSPESRMVHPSNE